MSISRKFQRSKSKYTLSQKIISAVTAAGFIMQPIMGFAGQIIKQNDLNNNLIKNGVADIWADKVVGNAAVNVFNKFNLSANEIANMYFSTEANKNAIKDNLVNFVNSRIDINGTVNAIKDNKIGGNLFFLSKDGMAVGKSGVINTGSLYVMTPATGIDINSQEYNYTYEGLRGTFDSGSEANINTALNRMQALNIPLNASGTISVLGKVNATGDVKMAAAKIGIGKNVSGVDLKDGENGAVATKAGDIVKTAAIKTGITDFSNFVNLTEQQQQEASITSLNAEVSSNGDIVLAAKAEYANTLDQTFNEIGNAIGLTGVDVPKSIEASVESYGSITARGNAELTAEATNGNKDLAEEVLKQTTDLGTKIPDYVPVPAADAGNYAQTVAKVEVQGDITAGQDIKVAANADNTYVDNGQGIEDKVSNILQYITPVNANVMILGSKAEVNIGEEADLTAEGVIDVTANSVLDGTAGAAVNGRKLITVSTVSQAGSFLPSAAVGYADVENSAKVDIQGSLTAKGANTTDENGEIKKAINIAAYAEESVANTANLNISSTTSKPNSSLIAAAVAVTKSSNTADVIIGSSVNAENGDVDITADTVNLLNANAASVAPDNTVGAAAVNVFSHDGHANIAVEGDITGQNVAIDATNLIDENTITANNELGMGKIQAQLVNAIDPDGLKNAVKNNEIVTAITTNIKNALGSSSSGDGSKTDITQVLSDKFEAGAAVVVTNENNSANVTFANTADVTATAGDITADADVRVVDYSFTASGTSNSYKKSAADGTTTTVTVGAGVVYAGMENEASVVFADGSGKEQHAELSAAGNINVTSSNIMEYNRPQRIFREIQRSIENIEYAIAAFDKLDEYQKQGMEEYRAGLENLKQSLKDYTTTYSNDFNETVKNPDAITAEGTMNKIYEMAAAAAVLYNQVVDLQTKYNTVQGSNELSAASAIISNSLTVVTNALAFADPNNYANVAAQASAKGGSESSKFAASGSVAVSDFSGTSGVKVGKYTKLEAGKDLNLESANEIEDVTITGKTMFWKNNAEAKGGVGIGGSFNYQNFDTDSSVVVEEGAELTAGDIAIASDSNVFHVGAMLGAGKSDGSALSGMVSLTDSDSYNNVIVDTDAKLTAQKDSGIISIDANNDTSVTNAIVTFSASGANAGVGMGVAINNIDVQNTAQIIDNDGNEDENEDENDGLEGKISASELNVNAETTGLINSVSVAGGMTSSGTDSEEGFLDKLKAPYNKMTEISDSALTGINNISNKLQNVIKTMDLNAGAGNGGTTGITSDDAGTPSFSFAGAGSVSLNMVSDTTKAVVDGANITLNNDGALQVGARDSAFTGAWSGAAGLSFRKEQQSQKSTSVAVSGAVGVNDIDNEITALVKDSTVKGAKDVDVAAVSGGTTVAAGLGATLTKDGGQGKNYSGGGSVSVNLLDKNVNANMEKVGLNGDEQDKADIDVAAYESDVQVTGGVNANIALGGGSLVGGGVTVADINNKINAGITGGTYKNVDNVNVKGLLAVTQVTAAVSAGIAVGGSGTNNAFGGAVVYNGLSNDITAGIDGAAITADGLVSVMAKDTDEANPYQNLLGDYNEHNKFAADNGIDTTGSSYYTGLNTNGESVNYSDNEGSTIVGAAAVVTAGSNSNAGGAAVNIADIDNDFTAKINYANITAENVRAEADADTLLVGAAGGVAAGTKNFGGMGSVSWQDIDNDITSEIINSEITTNSVTAKAVNKTQAVNVAGSVSVGKSAAVGATLAYNALDNTIGAYMRGNSINALDGGNVDVMVDADNAGKIYGIGAGVSASAKVAINGSVAVNRGGSNTEAIIDKSDKEESEITNAGTVNVTADDETYRLAVVGSVSASGKAAIGGGVAYNDIGGSSAGSESSSQNTTAAVRNTDITIAADGEKTVNVAAKDTSKLNTISAGVAAAATAGVQGSAATALVNKNVTAEIENTDIDNNNASKNANVTVDAQNNSKITTSADTASVAGQGAGVGAGVAVNRIIQQTNAAVNGGTMNVNNLTVNANGTPSIENIGIGIAVAGQGAGVSGSVAVNMIDNDVTAHIGDGANIVAYDNVGVIATSDEQIANYSGMLSGAGQGAGVGISVSVNQINGNTSATVGDEDKETYVTALGNDADLITNTDIADSEINNALISSNTVNIDSKIDRTTEKRRGLVVDASSTRDMKSFLINVAGAGQGAGVAPTVNVNMINGATNAGIANATVNGGSTGTTNAGNVFVNAGDYTNMSGFVGSGGIAGMGAGVGLGSDTNTVSRKVSAIVNDSDIKANALEVDADSKQGVSSFVVGAGVAGIGGGVAGVVTVTELENTTKAALLNSKVNASDKVAVEAHHTGIVNAGNVGVGAGVVGAGVGLSVGVAKDNSVTEVIVGDEENAATAGNTNIEASGDVTIAAENTTTVNPTVSATGIGAAGVSGATSVNNLNSTVKTNINNADITSNNGSISGTANNTINVDAYMGSNAAGIGGVGAGVTVNTIDSTVQTNVNDSTLNAKNDVTLTANEERNIEQLATNIAAGGIAAGANIAITSVGEAIGNEDSEKVSNKSDNYKEANDAAADKIKEANNAYSAKDTETLLGDSAEALGTAGIDDIKLSVGAGYGGLEDENGNKISQITVNITNSDIDAGNNVTAKATETDDIDMTLGSGAAGAAAVNAGVGILNVNRNVGVNITGGSIEAGTVDISTDVAEIDTDIVGNNEEDKYNVNLKVYQGSAGVIAANAAVGIVNTTGSSNIAINGVTITGKKVNIIAQDNSNTALQAVGVAAGAVALGALAAEANNDSDISVDIIDSAVTANGNTDDEGNINVETSKANEVTALAVNTAGGAIGGTGMGATVSDNGSSVITLIGNTMQADKNIDVAAQTNSELTANISNDAAGVFASGAVSIAGVNVGSANDRMATAVIIGNGNTFAAQNTNIGAASNITQSVDLDALSISGYGALSGNTATVNAYTDVGINVVKESAEENSNTYKGAADGESSDVNFNAENNVEQTSSVAGITASGLIASGTNIGETNSDLKTNISLNGSSDSSKINSLTVNANSKADITNNVNGDGGSAIDASPYAAQSSNNVKSDTTVNMSGNWTVAGDMNVNALHENAIDINADALKASVVGLSGVHSDNDIKNDTSVNFNNANVTTSGSQNISARNDIAYNAVVTGSGYGVAQGAAVWAEDDITSDAEVNVNSSKLDAKGSIDINALTGDAAYNGIDKPETAVNKEVTIKSAGVVAGTYAESTDTINFTNNINIGNGSSIKTTGTNIDNADITITAADRTNFTDVVTADTQGGAIGAAGTKLTNNITRTNNINVGGTVDSINVSDTIDSNYDANFDAGDSSVLNLTLKSNAFNKTAAPLATNPSISGIVTQNSAIDFASGSTVKSFRNINAAAGVGDTTVAKESKTWRWVDGGETGTGSIASTSDGTLSGDDAKITTTVTVDGTLEAGKNHQLDIIIDYAENGKTNLEAAFDKYGDDLKLSELGQAVDDAQNAYNNNQDVKDLQAAVELLNAAKEQQANNEIIKDRLQGQINNYNAQKQTAESNQKTAQDNLNSYIADSLTKYNEDLKKDDKEEIDKIEFVKLLEAGKTDYAADYTTKNQALTEATNAVNEIIAQITAKQDEMNGYADYNQTISNLETRINELKAKIGPLENAIKAAQENYDEALKKGITEDVVNHAIFNGHIGDENDTYVTVNVPDWYKNQYGSAAEQIGMIDYAASLLDRMNELIKMSQQYSGTDVGAKYTAELTRIQSDLQALGLLTVDSVGNIGIAEGASSVPTIELKDLMVSGGNVNISADTLNGKGNVTAHGDPSVKIINNTDFFLRVNDVKIDSDGGKVSHNDVSINPTGEGYKYNGVGITAKQGDSANGNNAQITIRNTTGTKASDSTLYTPDIGIYGEIYNPYGNIKIENDNNSIYVSGEYTEDGVKKSGSIKGRTINLTAGGSVTQGYTDEIYNVAGDPKNALDADYITAIQNALVNALGNKKDDEGEYYAAFDSIDKLAEFLTGLTVDGKVLDKETALQAAKQLTGQVNNSRPGIAAGGAIYINAASINVNGTLQSGFEEYKLAINRDKAAGLIEAGNTTGKDNLTYEDFMNNTWLVTAGETGAYYDTTKGEFVSGVQAWYNPITNEIFTEDIEQAGGGRIYLTGAIANTNASGGKLVVLDGGSDYTIDGSVANAGKYTFKLGSINAETVDGRIEINDTSSGQTVKTVYTNADVDDNGKATYNPTKGQYYNWSNGTESRVTTSYKHVSDSSWWGLSSSSWESVVGQLDEVTKDQMQVGEPVTTDGKQLDTGNVITNGSVNGYTQLGTEGSGTTAVTGSTAKNDKTLYQIMFERKGKPKQGKNDAGELLYLDANGELTTSKEGTTPYYLRDENGKLIYETVISDKVTTTKKKGLLGLWGKTVTTEWKETSGVITAYNFGLKADNPIGIEFVGYADGSRGTITSNSDILLGGDIRMGQVNITSGGSINHVGDATVISDNAEFNAHTGIDVIQKNVNNALTLNAKTAGGNINIQALAANTNNMVYIDNVSTGAGNVRITAEGSLLNYHDNVTSMAADTAVVSGDSITLQSYGGSIGTKDDRLLIDGDVHYGVDGDTTHGAVKAKAADGIYLAEVNGNMYLGEIVAENGDVVLEVKGEQAGFVDAIENNSNGNKDDNRLEEWTKLGLLGDDTVDKTQNNQKNQLTNLENAALNGSMFMGEDGTVSLEEAQKQGETLVAKGNEFVNLMKGDSADVQAAREDLNAKQGALNEAIANLGDSAESKAAYKDALEAYNAAYDHYAQVGADYEQAKANFIENSGFKDNAQAVEWLYNYEAIRNAEGDNYGWTQQQLLYAVQDTVINPEAGSVSDVKTANVTGNNITFISDTGKLGVVDTGETTIVTDELTAMFTKTTLTDEDQAMLDKLDKLASARAGDVTWGEENITIKRTTPVSVKLNGDNGKVTVKNTSGQTADHVYLLAKDSVLNADKFAANDLRLSGQEGINVGSVTGDKIILEGGSGDIGYIDKNDVDKTLQAIQVTLTNNGYVSANAAGNIKLQQILENPDEIVDFTLGSVAGTNVDITANGNIVSKADDIGYINASGTINLTSEDGGIGTTTKGLRIKNSGAVVNTDVQDAVNIEAVQDGTLILGEMKQESGGVTVESEGTIMLGREDNAETTDKDESVTGYIEAKDDVNLHAAEDIIISGKLHVNKDNGNLNLQADNGDITQTTIEATENIAVDNLNVAAIGGDVKLDNPYNVIEKVDLQAVGGSLGLTVSNADGFNVEMGGFTNKKGGDVTLTNSDGSVKITTQDITDPKKQDEANINGSLTVTADKVVEETEANVNNYGILNATGDISFNAEDNVNNKGAVKAGADVDFDAGNDVSNESTVSAGADVSFGAGKDIINNDIVDAGRNVNFNAAEDIYNNNTVNADETIEFTAVGGVINSDTVNGKDVIMQAIEQELENILAKDSVTLNGDRIHGQNITQNTEADGDLIINTDSNSGSGPIESLVIDKIDANDKSVFTELWAVEADITTVDDKMDFNDIMIEENAWLENSGTLATIYGNVPVKDDDANVHIYQSYPSMYVNFIDADTVETDGRLLSLDDYWYAYDQRFTAENHLRWQHGRYLDEDWKQAYGYGLSLHNRYGLIDYQEFTETNAGADEVAVEA